MNEIKKIFGENLQYLRKEKGVTQQVLADKLNYSPKAVSKWERGESIPEIEVLMQIAEYFNVTVDFLVRKDSVSNRPEYTPEEVKDKNLLFTTILGITVVWVIVSIIFVYLKLINDKSYINVFSWGLPASCLIIAIAYRKKKRNFQAIIYSIMLWTFLVSLYLELLSTYNMYLIFIVGIPTQIAIFVWSRIIKIK